MNEEYLDHVQAYMNAKKYDTKNHKEVANIVKNNLKAHNYNLTNSELLHFHEVEIVMIMVVITKMEKKFKQFFIENLALLLCVIFLTFLCILSNYGKQYSK